MNLIIFTDLDGTLLDHHDYNFDAAQPALNELSRRNIPVIINSSKTYAEIKDLRIKMHNNSAFAVENGAAVYYPTQGSGQAEQLEQTILGKPLPFILEQLAELRSRFHFQFQSFADMSNETVAEITGLSVESASLAKQRQASEPLLWQDSADNLEIFKQQLAKNQLQLLQGGRFYHVMGQNDKSLAMAWLLNNYYQTPKQTVIALGDSANDRKMLECADFAAIIRKTDHSYLAIEKDPEAVFNSPDVAPLGWRQAIDFIFNKLGTGDTDE